LADLDALKKSREKRSTWVHRSKGEMETVRNNARSKGELKLGGEDEGKQNSGGIVLVESWKIQTLHKKTLRGERG